jgi:glycine cleavage system aminomethyltransferase T
MSEQNNTEEVTFYEGTEGERNFSLPPCIPADPNVTYYGKIGKTLYPKEYTNWMEETMSWKKTCYIHAGLSMGMACIKLKGSDAEKFLSENSISDFSTLKTGRGRHTIFCNEHGHVMSHGMVMRLGKEEFDTYSIEHILRYIQATKEYKVDPITVEYNDFVFQIGGPTSLQTIEHACQEDLHKLKFMNFCEATIANHKVRVMRMGMAGTLSYEVHGTLADGIEVYNAIFSAGQPFGIKKLGELLFSYMCNHTENGFPQDCCHFYDAFREDPKFYEWYRANLWPEHPGVELPWDQGNSIEDMHGTLGDNITDYYRNPIELGWGSSIHWNHEFVGKAALKKIAENNPRKAVTLIWNAKDVLDVYASYLREEGEPYLFMPWPRGDGEGNFQLKVEDKKGKAVGVTTYRTYTLYSRKNLSLGTIDASSAEIGNEVVILWGDKDKHPIKKIRAKVAKFPYLDLPRNEEYDIESIPHFKRK